MLVLLIPAPRGAGVVSAPVPKKLQPMAGIYNCYTSARGSTATLASNFPTAASDAISKTYSYLTPDVWEESVSTKSPYQNSLTPERLCRGPGLQLWPAHDFIQGK